MTVRAALVTLIATVLTTGCSAAIPEYGSTMASATIGGDQPEAILRLDRPAGTRAFLTVDPGPDARDAGLSIAVFADEGVTPIQRLALFPPDRPARFVLVIPKGARTLRIRAESESKGKLPMAHVRLDY